ncbi:MAG: universal stress protein [Parvibaculum sp.]|nr:universal stress protein [Parvibaculum sp.]
MAVRKILVPLSGVATEAAVLGTAMTVAKTFGAQLVGLFVRADPTEALPFLGDGVSGQVVEQLMQAAKEGSDKASAKARAMFVDAATKADLPVNDKANGGTLPSARFLDVSGHRDDVVASHSRLSDLVVFGEGNAGAAGGSTLEAAMMSAGRPVLIAPKACAMHVGGTVAIGWDNSVMAAHAVTAAIPFLEEAKSVSILCIGAQALEEKPGQLLADYLALHGIYAGIHLTELEAGRSVGGLLLDQAEKLGADLLVVGGYGHSRLREFIIGGATQHIRSHATIPVLMAH